MTPAPAFSPEAVHRLLADRGWRLLDDAPPPEWEAFLADVAACTTGPNPQAASLNRAVTMAYGRVLYTASLADGTRRQQRAFTELGAWVYRQIHRQVADENDAEDLMQEVLLTVFRERHKVDRPLGFLAWVTVIIRNRLQAYYRSRDKRPPDADGEHKPDELLVEPPPSTVESEEFEANLLALLKHCLGRQAHTQRLVFVELLLRGRSFAEIAATYHMNVRSLQRAWERLRIALRRCDPLITYLLAHLPLSHRTTYNGR